MASQLLRKVKSFVPAAPKFKHHSDSDAGSSSSRQPSGLDLSTAVESPLSISTRASFYDDYSAPLPHPPSTVTQLKRRLARKASTFSLRTKSRRGARINQKQQTPSPRATLENTLAPSTTRGAQSSIEKTLPRTPAPVPPTPSPTSSHDDDTTPTQRNFSRPRSPPPPTSASSFSPPTNNRLNKYNGTWSKMAAEASAPPIPFLRLKGIATEACSTTLAPHKSYIHSSTESWNTQIINSILSALVKESTPPGSSQPQWKYVVNSTIIQHQSQSSKQQSQGTTSTGTQADPADPSPTESDTPATAGQSSSTTSPGGGRRGMHAASGAYWNNEKDGMWSFKYEAAEGKGLDIVIGVVWIWVG